MILSTIISAVALITSGFSFIYFKSNHRNRTGIEQILMEKKKEIIEDITDMNDVTEKYISLMEDKNKALKKIMDTTNRRLALHISEQYRHHRMTDRVQENLGRIQKESSFVEGK